MRSGLLLAVLSAPSVLALLNVEHFTPPLFSVQDVAEDVVSNDKARAPTIHRGVFQQLIDHDNPDLGTFDQHYWWNEDWYTPGSPVVLFTPGELPAAPYEVYVTNATIMGFFAMTNGGASVMLEHRYWGESSPFEVLTAENLKYLTLNNSIQDLVYFANNVRFSFDCNRSSTPDKAPWILAGGSYPGALTTWTHHLAPGTFWAYWASSGVVQAIENFWQYFVPLEQGMARNCSTDMARAIEHIDGILLTGTDEEKQALKDSFALGDVKHDDDFAGALQTPLWFWQTSDFWVGYTQFHQFCDYLENQWPGSNQSIPGPDGVGTQKAVEGWAKWSREQLVPGYCKNTYGYWDDELETECFNSHNGTNELYGDLSPSNKVNRQWYWFICNEPFTWFQIHAPADRPSIVSRLIGPEYWEAQCTTLFGEGTYGLAKGRTPEAFNAYTGGWERRNTTRIMWSNGEFDGWTSASVSSQFRPDGPLESTEEAPVFLIPKGIHCSDMFTVNTRVNAGLKKVFDEEVAIMKRWVGEFYQERGMTRL